MVDIPHRKWPSIERRKCANTIVVTEKIDGTNGVIYVSPDGNVLAGSRNRWLVPEWIRPNCDNYGFAGWVNQNADILAPFLGEGYHYGEWFGYKIQRGYGLPVRRWAMFRAKHITPPIDSIVTVPVLYVGEDIAGNDISGFATNLLANGSVLVPGYDKPEGIVIQYTNPSMHKWTFDGPKWKVVEI